MTDNINNQNKEGMSIANILAGIILGLIACALITLCTSCTTTKYVPVIEHHTDTVMVNKVQKDSVFLHDSTYVYEKGDTFYMERWHTKYVLKELHDTLYQSKTDSIPYPVEVTKEVPAQLTWWQQTRIHVGGVVIWLALIILIVYIIRIFRKAHTLP
jgi:hypothetical protein